MEVFRSRAAWGWEIFDYLHLVLWKLLGATEGKWKCKQHGQRSLLTRLLTGNGLCSSPAPCADLAPSLHQELLNDMSTWRAGSSHRRGIRFYAPQFHAVKENIPIKCELIGSCNWHAVQLPSRWAGRGGLSTVHQAAAALKPIFMVGVHAGPLC